MPSKKLPRDSVIAYIPLSVTADLGVAMRRVRAKRIAQIKEICPELFQQPNTTNQDTGSTTAVVAASTSQDQSGLEHIDSENDDSQDEFDNDDDNNQNRKSTTIHSNNNNTDTIVRREQFGSIVEYLEAKYARGVMIDDLDERIRERKKKKKESQHGKGKSNDDNEKNLTHNDDKDDNDMSVLSDSAAGSCYSVESGNFIDDSELRKEVAHQILGSSAYGKTKIEALSLDRAAVAANEEDASLMMEEDDHGFFVNVGDLEMEDGWTEHDLDDDEDWIKMMAKAKGLVQYFFYIAYYYFLKRTVPLNFNLTNQQYTS